MADPATLKVSPPFSDLLPIRAADRSIVIDSMRRDGYHQQSPILIWEERDIVLDGHTRRDCAIELGIEVATCRVSFATEDDAMMAAIQSQTEKGRELTSAEKARLIPVLDKLRQRGGGFRGNQYTESKVVKGPIYPFTKTATSATETGELLGLPEVTVKRARKVRKESPDLYEKIEAGELTFNGAYEENQKRKGKGRLVIAEENRRAKSTPLPRAGFSDAPTPNSKDCEPETPIDDSSSPIRAKLANTQNFDLDVRLYVELKPMIDALDQAARNLIGPASLAWMSPLRKAIHDASRRLALVPNPPLWELCPECKGSAMVASGTCPKCKGSGYRIPGL